jgi:outer membrane protein TolC
MRWLPIVVLGVTSPAQALDMRAAVEEARANAFPVRTAKLAVDDAKGAARISAAPPNPAFLVGAGPSLGCFGEGCRDGSPALVGQVSDQSALFTVLTGKLALRSKAATATVQAREDDVRDAWRRMAAEVKTRFVDVVLAVERLNLAKAASDRFKRSVELAQARLRAGAVDEADVLGLTVLWLQADQTVSDATGDLEFKRAALATALGRPTPSLGDVEAPGWLSEARPALPSLDEAALQEKAVEMRPDVASAKAPKIWPTAC